MPSTEREAFLLNRVEQLKYAEIAIRLNVSVRTVEVRISKALKFLKLNLSNFLSIVTLGLAQNVNEDVGYELGNKGLWGWRRDC